MSFLHVLRRKNRVYVLTLLTRNPRQIVGFDVAYDKNEKLIQKIVDKVVKAKFYYSNENPRYQNVSYFGKYYYFRDKFYTFTFE